MTETISEILEDIGFEHWDEVDQVKLAELMHNLAAGKDNAPALEPASETVVKAFIRIIDTHLERYD